jgi:hypothetical protein
MVIDSPPDSILDGQEVRVAAAKAAQTTAAPGQPRAVPATH